MDITRKYRLRWVSDDESDVEVSVTVEAPNAEEALSIAKDRMASRVDGLSLYRVSPLRDSRGAYRPNP